METKVTNVKTCSTSLLVEIDVIDDEKIVECHTIDLPFNVLPPALCYQIAGMIAGVNGYYRPSDDTLQGK